LDGIELAHEVLAKLSELIRRKQRGGELGTDAPWPVLNTFIAGEIERVAGFVATAPDETVSEDVLNRIAWRELGL
jgi:hypothetical protein